MGPGPRPSLESQRGSRRLSQVPDITIADLGLQFQPQLATPDILVTGRRSRKALAEK
jgi:hypothetical protein